MPGFEERSGLDVKQDIEGLYDRVCVALVCFSVLESGCKQIVVKYIEEVRRVVPAAVIMLIGMQADKRKKGRVCYFLLLLPHLNLYHSLHFLKIDNLISVSPS